MTTLIERLNEDGAVLALEAASELAHLQASVATRDTQIASLRAALKSILDRYEDQNISHIDFRVGAQRVAASALLRDNEQTAEKSTNG